VRHLKYIYIATSLTIIACNNSSNTATKVSPHQLYADYEANEVAADLKYKDKVLIVTGKVQEITKDYDDQICVTIYTGDIIGTIRCSFATSHTNEVAGLEKGQSITIKGKCEGKSIFNVNLGGCSLQ